MSVKYKEIVIYTVDGELRFDIKDLRTHVIMDNGTFIVTKKDGYKFMYSPRHYKYIVIVPEEEESDEIDIE